MIQAVTDVILTGFVCTAAWLDWASSRIPNWLTVTGLAAALLLRALAGSVVCGLEGCGVAFTVAVLLYALGAIGGGDVKLLAAVGAFLGVSEVAGGLAAIGVAGAGFALITVVRRGLVPLLIFNTFDLLKSWRTLGRGRASTLETPGVLTIAYGVPIAMGTLFWWFGQGVRL
jgi:prepilin peptidase CpaA